MAKNSIDAYGASGKSNLLFFDPEALHLVIDKSSPLYDERVDLPTDENLVRNVMHHGVIQPIVVSKNTETGQTEVVAGRQRVKAAREANKRLRERGEEPLQVPAVPKRLEGASLAGMMVSENELRKSDSPMGRARKMQHLKDLGKGDDELAVLFGCTVPTIRSTLALLECCGAVRNAVEAGKIGAGHALKLSKMPPYEQKERLSTLLAASNGLKGHARAKAQAAAIEPARPRMRTRKEVAERLATLPTDSTWHGALQWVLNAS